MPITIGCLPDPDLPSRPQPPSASTATIATARCRRTRFARFIARSSSVAVRRSVEAQRYGCQMARWPYHKLEAITTRSTRRVVALASRGLAGIRAAQQADHRADALDVVADSHVLVERVLVVVAVDQRDDHERRAERVDQ